MTTSSPFSDINIVGLDVERSHNPDPQSALYHMYLELCHTPPPEWERIFDAERSSPRHTMWRRAWIEGQYIVVHCVPEELEQYHLRDLKQDVANANVKYRQYLTDLAQNEIQERGEQQAEDRRLNDIADRLDFD